MNSIVKFFHELWHPHCDHCKNEQEDNKVCQSCETLRTQLEIANYEKKQLLNSVLENNKPPVETPVPKDEVKFDPLKTSMPWRVRQQLLEENSRKEAELLRKSREELKSVEQLEEELLPLEKAGE